MYVCVRMSAFGEVRYLVRVCAHSQIIFAQLHRRFWSSLITYAIAACVYDCVCVCICACMYMWVYVCMCAFGEASYLLPSVCVYVCKCMCACMCVYVCVCVLCVYVCV